MTGINDLFGSLGSMGGIGEQTLIWLGFLGGLLIFGFLIFMIVSFLKYNIIVRVLEDGRESVATKGALIKTKEGKYVLRLLKKKLSDDMPPPQSNQYFRERGKKLLYLYKNTEGLLSPISKIVVNSPPVFVGNVNLQQALAWHIGERKKAEEKHKNESFWSKYGTVIMNIGTLLICFVLILFVLRYVNEMVGTAASATGAIKEAVEMMVRQKV